MTTTLKLTDPVPPEVIELISQFSERNLQNLATRFWLLGRAQGRVEGHLAAEKIVVSMTKKP